MASVDDIKQFEGYLAWDLQDDGVLLVTPHKRDWTRTNYQMDVRYIESMFYTSRKKMVTIKADLSKMKVWHLDWSFLHVLLRDLKHRIKNRIHSLILVNSTLPVWYAHWWMRNNIPKLVREKIVWK